MRRYPTKKKRPPEGFCERLRQAFYDSGLSLMDIERRYGIAHGNMIGFMDGDYVPTSATLATLCVALNVSADWLLFGKKEV